MQDQSRLISTVSYITIVGWVIALILRQNENPKSELSLFHLRQSFAVLILAFLAGASRWFFYVISLGLIGNLLTLALFILWLIGIIGAIQGRFTRLPFIGDWIQENLHFIN